LTSSDGLFIRLFVNSLYHKLQIDINSYISLPYQGYEENDILKLSTI